MEDIKAEKARDLDACDMALGCEVEGDCAAAGNLATGESVERELYRARDPEECSVGGVNVRSVLISSAAVVDHLTIPFRSPPSP